MGKKTLSQAKNDIRACLQEAVDPPLSGAAKERVRAYFEYSCIYCGQQLGPSNGDIDHLIPRSKSGLNHISNRVLSCKACNGNDKRDKDWETFVRERRAGDDAERTLSKIRDWVAANALSPAEEEVLQAKKAEADKSTIDVLKALDAAYKKLRFRP